MALISDRSPEATMNDEPGVTGGGAFGVVVRGGTGIQPGEVAEAGAGWPGDAESANLGSAPGGGTGAEPAAGVGRGPGGAMLKLPVDVFFGGLAGGATGGMDGTGLLTIGL